MFPALSPDLFNLVNERSLWMGWDLPKAHLGMMVAPDGAVIYHHICYQTADGSFQTASLI